MALGLAAAVLAAVCYECGYVLQALEAKVAPADLALRASLLARLVSRRRWLTGTALMLAGAVLQITALALAPVTLVQPVLALGLVGLLALARVRLGEHVGATGVAGAALLIAGVAAVGIADPGRSNHVTSVEALVVLLAPIAVITVLPYALRGRTPIGVAVAAAAGGDALAAVAMKLTANAIGVGHPLLALVGAAGAALAGGLALTAEMSALRVLPATRVAPVVLGAQVIVPAIAAVVAFGESSSPTLVLGVCAAGVGAGLLGSSGSVAGMRPSAGPADPEALADHTGGGRQRVEPVPR
jgi:drug/metabolite transporter (DMT)-like permease